MFLLRLLYRPFAIIGAIIAGKLGRSVFRSIWAKIDHEPPPMPGSGEGGADSRSWRARRSRPGDGGTAAAVDRTFARFFHHLIGTWPKKPPEPDED